MGYPILRLLDFRYAQQQSEYQLPYFLQEEGAKPALSRRAHKMREHHIVPSDLRRYSSAVTSSCAWSTAALQTALCRLRLSACAGVFLFSWARGACLSAIHERSRCYFHKLQTHSYVATACVGCMLSSSWARSVCDAGVCMLYHVTPMGCCAVDETPDDSSQRYQAERG